ncbi:MAG: hypothetical protein AAB262_04590 [Elusimicrobiota bacterium]
MRAIMLAVYLILVYYAVRAVLRRLRRTPPKPTRPDSADGEMVLDHECRVYVLKNRAVTRHIRGSVLYFCGPDCAATHAARSRD